MDALVIRQDSPQEDEFALMTLGVPSAYRAFLMPHRIGEMRYTLDQAFWLQRPEWLETWEQFLTGVLSRLPVGREPLILKSPNHTYRLRSILQRFPQSKLIWIARDPATVLHSNRKMWHAMFGEYGMTPTDPVALDDFLAAALEAAAEALRWCGASLDERQLAVLSHRDLWEAPEASVRALMRHLLPDHPLDEAALRVAASRIRRPDIDSGYSDEVAYPLRLAVESLRDAYANMRV